MADPFAPAPHEILCMALGPKREWKKSHNVAEPETELLYTAGNDMIIRVWDERRVANREKTWPEEKYDESHAAIELSGHEDSITALVFDGSTLFSGDDAGKIMVWDTELHVQMRMLAPPDSSTPPPIRQLLVVPAPGMLCSVVTDGSLVLWDIVQAKVRRVVEGVRWVVEVWRKL